MSDKLKVKLLRPLDDEPIGAEVEFDKVDAERLEGFGAVKILRKSSREQEAQPKQDEDSASDKVDESADQEKSAPAPENKTEPAPQNKATGKAPKKAD